MPALLFVTPMTPGRASGGALASLAVLRALRGRGWDLHLVQNSNAPPSEEVAALCREVTIVHRPDRVTAPLGTGLSRLLRCGYWPKYQREVRETVERLLLKGGYDLLLLDHLLSVEYGRFAREAGFALPIVLRAHNVESQLEARGLPHLRSPRLVAESLARLRRLRAIESSLARYCDLALAISALDARQLGAWNPGLPVEVLPSPADTDHFRPGPKVPAGKEIVFIGGMNWRPNAHGICWFVEEVLWRVFSRHPEAHLTVIGDSPPDRLRSRPGVSALGFVPDERAIMARARVVIVPIRFGSGVRIKILNSLTMGKAVVSTGVGAEGIPVQDGESILIADDGPAFAEAVCRLLEDDALVARLARNGPRLCLEQHGPLPFAERLDALLRGVLRRAASPAA
ncbi:MAG TPA: glycosyltransferase family 4 protein [Anaeromyxobacter sp.]|nr:glycosyltransferase family 4 protein [Anaeromyxobacter sp.]